jgi:iron-sulfur cluster assembly protein
MISLTEPAAKKIKSYLQKRGTGLGIRVGVRTTGCSGLAYVLEYIDSMTEHDQIFESHGVNVYIDPKSLAYIQGLEMDWVRNGLNEGFEFRNPNERDRCGCGESFRI